MTRSASPCIIHPFTHSPPSSVSDRAVSQSRRLYSVVLAASAADGRSSCSLLLVGRSSSTRWAYITALCPPGLLLCTTLCVSVVSLCLPACLSVMPVVVSCQSQRGPYERHRVHDGPAHGIVVHELGPELTRAEGRVVRRGGRGGRRRGGGGGGRWGCEQGEDGGGVAVVVAGPGGHQALERERERGRGTHRHTDRHGQGQRDGGGSG